MADCKPERRLQWVLQLYWQYDGPESHHFQYNQHTCNTYLVSSQEMKPMASFQSACQHWQLYRCGDSSHLILIGNLLGRLFFMQGLGTRGTCWGLQPPCVPSSQHLCRGRCTASREQFKLLKMWIALWDCPSVTKEENQVSVPLIGACQLSTFS